MALDLGQKHSGTHRKRPLNLTHYRSCRLPRRTIWLAVLCLQAITTSNSLVHELPTKSREHRSNKDEDNGLINWSQLLPALQEALSDASIHSNSQLESPSAIQKRDRRRRWRKRWKRFRNACDKVARSSTGVACVADSPLVAATAMAAASVERQVKQPTIIGPQLEHMYESERNDIKPVRRRGTNKRKKKRKRKDSDHPDLETETIEGARLISASFGLVADTFGLLADSVRVVGDTAAGVTGSTVKLVGTAVKSVSSGLDNASRILEPNSTKDATGEEMPRRKPLTSERLMDRKRGITNDYDRDKTSLLGNTRHVAAKSVRLLGSVVRGVGDTLVLAGGATESIAASTAGVAEDAVRIVESFAGSVSFAVKNHFESGTEREEAEPTFDSFDDFPPDDDEASFITFGTSVDDDDSIPSDATPTAAASLVHRLMTSERGTMVMALIDVISELSRDVLVFVMADTDGVPSFAPDLLGVMFLCYLAALLTLSSSRKETTSVPASRQVVSSSRWSGVLHLTNQRATVANTENSSLPVNRLHVDFDDDSTCMSDQESFSDSNDQTGRIFVPQHVRVETAEKNTAKANVLGVAKRFVLLPWKLICVLVRCTFCLLFSRNTALLGIYGIAWLYLCRVSQLRSATIHRKGESMGFHSAVSSIGTTSPTVAESVVWLNTLLNQIWRVQYDPGSKIGQKWSKELLSYPHFVTRAVESSMGRQLRWNGPDSTDTGSHGLMPYGGLEPYISSSIGRSLLNVLDSSKASRPNDVAYVSLHSFTLGSKPPLIRSMELRGVEQGGQIARYLVDVDALLDDFSLVVEVKLSSLEYAMIPSTKISIHSIEMRVPLQLSLSARPDYPYLSKLRLSLAHAPDCKVRITPLNDDSGLRGIDLGSLPVINDWIREAIKESLSEYVSPKYINIDLGALLSSSSRKLSTPAPTVPDISKMRQKTRAKLDPNPRTSSKGGITMTSVADHLASQHSATKAAGGPLGSKATPGRPPFLVKPRTELAQLGMERWIAKTPLIEEEEEMVAEENTHPGLVGTLAKPLGVLAPFVFAIAAGVFRDKLVDDGAFSNSSET